MKKNYKIALISNTGRLHSNYWIKKYKLKEIFPVRVFSYKVKIQKPHKKIFRAALKKLKVKPNEAVFIDDRSENVKGVKKLGIQGIHFKNNKQTFGELRKLGIK